MERVDLMQFKNNVQSCFGKNTIITKALHFEITNTKRTYKLLLLENRIWNI